MSVSLVDHELSRYLRYVGEFSRGIVRSAYEDEVGLLDVVDDARSRHQCRVTVHGIRISGHRGDCAVLGEDSRKQHDEFVASCAQGDLVQTHVVHCGDRASKRFVATTIVFIDVREGAREGPRARARRRRGRCVAVEADDLARVQVDLGGDSLVRRRPLVGVERLARGHRRAVALCAGMSSRSANASMVGARRSSPSLVTRWTVTVFMKPSSPSPPVVLAQPPVGSTWLPPVA